MRCVSGVAAWIVTNKADGFGLTFSATNAEYAWGVDCVVDDRTITMSRSSFRRKGGAQYAHEQTYTTAFSRYDRRLHGPGRNASCPRLISGQQINDRLLGPLGAGRTVLTNNALCRNGLDSFCSGFGVFC
jgi:hypothetical protein